jgi:hypothetical protein
LTDRRLVFVMTAADAPAHEPGSSLIVLDTAWTPGVGDRADVRSVRPAISSVVERLDLFHEALERLDTWAEQAAIADRMTVDGVSWWYRARPFLADHLHERLVWAYVLGSYLTSVPIVGVTVPEREIPLVDVARAFASRGLDVKVTPDVAAGPPASQRAEEPIALLAAGRRWLTGGQARWRRREFGRRAHLLGARLAMLSSAGRVVLVIAQPRIYQTVRVSSRERLIDPQLTPVIDSLAGRGLQPIVIGLQLDHRVDADWAILRSDERLFPQSLVNTGWVVPDEQPVDASTVAERLRTARGVPLDVEGGDLAPSLVDELMRYGGSWLASQLRLAGRAERMMRDLRASAMFLNHEGIRTPWITAARHAGVPVFAVQHGLIYARHTVYSHPRRQGLLLPDRTFTYGPFERTVLLEHGGYTADEVEVSGSPRLYLDSDTFADTRGIDGERAEVRRELGVSPGDIMLVVSTAHTALFQRFYLPHMLDRLLGGPLPGVHVVFKQHPGETDKGPYRALLEGMARAGGYATPPITVVRDTDLYRLLRAADAHLGLHSTVLTDAVAAGTCNLISTAQAYGDLLGYVAAGVARPVRDVAELRAALANPLPTDPATRRTFLERHFRPGDASERIAGAIERVVEQGGDVSGAVGSAPVVTRA